MGNLRHDLKQLPEPSRYAVVGLLALGLAGAVAGLVIGLFSYPPTAWFAVIEVGLPSAIVGGLLGLAAGSVVHVLRRQSDRTAV
jgi:hypothetical protein